jgi:hypothetical protein
VYVRDVERIRSRIKTRVVEAVARPRQRHVRDEFQRQAGRDRRPPEDEGGCNCETYSERPHEAESKIAARTLVWAGGVAFTET